MNNQFIDWKMYLHLYEATMSDLVSYCCCNECSYTGCYSDGPVFYFLVVTRVATGVTRFGLLLCADLPQLVLQNRMHS